MNAPIPDPQSIAGQTVQWARDNGFAVWYTPETASTNTYAKSQVPTSYESLGRPRRLYISSRQNAGRGRGTHTWSNPRNALLSTWTFDLKFAPQPILSPLIGLALFKACRSAYPEIDFNLKAPNDLYSGTKKIAGLLIENVMLGERVTCAIGLGLNTGDAPAELNDIAVGLSQLLSEALISERWPRFLAAWTSGAEDALEASRQSEMTTQARNELAAALNLHPLLAERIVEIGPLGQIHFASHSLDWSEL